MSDLEGAELDKAVAEALGIDDHCIKLLGKHCLVDKFHPSINGQQAIDLQREFGLTVKPRGTVDGEITSWVALKEMAGQIGPTPEVAICRVVVAMGGSNE